MTSFPPLLTLASADDDAAGEIAALLNRLRVVDAANAEAEAYYDGSHVARQFGISIPPSMRDLRTVAGWGGTVVDVVEERLDWLGWSGDDENRFGLREVYAANALDLESGMAHLDSLIFGVTFASVGTGRDGEPSPLVVTHSPREMTARWDRRTRRVASALYVGEVDEQGAKSVTLYGPEFTDTFERSNGIWKRVDRDEHELGRVPVVALANRVRGSRDYGRSEITKSIRYYADAAERTLLGLEVNREFYNAPQRIGLNIPEDAFTDPAGNPVSQWSSIQGRVWMIPPNEDGDAPDVKQFNPASPAPYIDQVKGYAQLLAAEAGIPSAYLGFHSDNPSSADAIKAGEARLVKRAERRQAAFGRSWLEVARLALLVRDGVVPAEFDTDVSAKWRDASTPTRSAAADETTKYVGAGILPIDSTVTYDRMGLTEAEQRQLEADKRRADGGSLIDALIGESGNTATDNKEEADALRSKFEALGVAIRAGVDPEAAAQVLGLAGITFTGATPVTLRLPESEARGLEEK